MKKYDFCVKCSVLLLLALVTSSCDFFRSLAGRPTSADIEAIRAERSLEEARKQSVRDSLEQAELKLARYAAYRDSLHSSGISIVNSAKVHTVSAADMPHNYYIMVGTFSSEENADKLVGKLEAAGYEAVKLSSANGRFPVAVNPSDNPEEVYQTLKKLKNEPFCPADVWIYSKE